MYNFESSTGPTVPFSRGVNPDGRLLDPETRWGGLMRGIDNTNFEAANVEYIEFWLLDPLSMTIRGMEAISILISGISAKMCSRTRVCSTNMG